MIMNGTVLLGQFVHSQQATNAKDKRAYKM